MVDVSIVYVNYNSDAMILASIESLLQYVKSASYEIIIVDNHSKKESLTNLESALSENEMVRLVPLAENVGFGRANNAAIPYVSGKYLFLLNPDTLLLNDAVSILKFYLDHHDSVGACGGNLFDEAMHPTTSFHRVFPSITAEMNALFFYLPEKIKYGRNSYFNHNDYPINVAAITGADLMIKRTVIEKTGLFNDSFFMYYEDTELCHRIRRNGYEIVCVPDAHIQHLEGRSSSNMKRKANLVFKGRKNYYIAVNRSKLYRGVCNVIFSLSCCFRTVLGVFQGKDSFYYWSRLLSNCLSVDKFANEK